MQGLGNSGYAETTRTSLYNAYQKSVTDTLNNANDLKADYDFKIQQARQNGSIQQAQSALELYAQKIQLLTQNYQLRQWQQQFNLQKKNLAKSSSRSSSKKSSNKSTSTVSKDSNSVPSYQEIIDNMKVTQGVGPSKIIDGLTGKAYNSGEELLAAYGYKATR